MSIVPKQVCVDFDGCIAYHQYPNIGGPAPEAIRVLNRLRDAGHTLILLTMRDGELLENAIKWCTNFGIKWDFVNRNSMLETGSRKVYAHLYIDDHGLGMPLIQPPAFDYSNRKPIVDWKEVEKLLEKQKYL